MKIKIKIKANKKITYTEPLSEGWESKTLFSSLNKNKKAFENIFSKCSDVIYRPLVISEEKIPALLIFIKEYSDEQKMSNYIIKPLTEIDDYFTSEKNTDFLIDKLISENIINSQIDKSKTFGEASYQILSGNSLLIIDGYSEAIQITTKGRKYRQLTEPTTEVVLSGPKEGFTESLDNNTVLVRDRLISAKLKVEKFVIGRVSKTNLHVLYIEGIIKQDIVERVIGKIKEIDIDGIINCEYVKESIVNNTKTIFPLINKTERPDKIAAELLEGKLAIMVEGCPFVLIAPAIFISFMQSPEDYYQNFYFASFIRILRYFLLIISFLSPGVYLAAITFHQELLPTGLAYSIASARQGVPFPGFWEVFFMMTMFEAFREAGIRLPKQVGQSISIVGAIIIGQAAVSAKLVSPATVIVVAVTGISSFAIPCYDFALTIRLLVFPIIFLGSWLGFYGVMICCVVILIHLASLDSFGVPYLSTIAPFSASDMKDTFIRRSWLDMIKRPSWATSNTVRNNSKNEEKTTKK